MLFEQQMRLRPCLFCSTLDFKFCLTYGAVKDLSVLSDNRIFRLSDNTLSAKTCLIWGANILQFWGAKLCFRLVYFVHHSFLLYKQHVRRLRNILFAEVYLVIVIFFIFSRGLGFFLKCSLTGSSISTKASATPFFRSRGCTSPFA